MKGFLTYIKTTMPLIETHRRIGIRTKITLIICLVAAIVAAVGVSLGYLWGYSTIHDTIGADYVRMAQLLAASISRLIEEEIEDVKVYASYTQWRQAIHERNAAYEGMKATAMQRYFKDMDKQWQRAAHGDPLLTQYLENEAGRELRNILEDDSDIVEMFITDRFGGLVAASGKTYDFYQADERWWWESFSSGKGKVFVADVALDRSINTMAMDIAVPIRDASGAVIGICKAVVDAESLFEHLGDFQIGKTGEASLINKQGDIIFYQNVATMSMKLCPAEELEELFDDKKGFQVLQHEYVHEGERFVAFADVISPLLARMGIEWVVVIDGDKEEIFAPLGTFMNEVGKLIPILIVVMIPLGFLCGGMFVRPIRRLNEATKRIAKGNLDYKADVTTADEIGELAVAFNQMTDDLKRTTTSIVNLNREMAERKEAEERTKSLSKFPSENPNPVLRVAEDGTILYANPMSNEVLYSWGCRVGHLVPDEWRAIITDCIKYKRCAVKEEYCKRHVFSFVIAPVRYTNYVNLYGHDITDRKKMEGDLERDWTLFRTTVTGLPLAVFVLSREGRFVLSEGQGLEVLDLLADKILGRAAAEIFHDKPEILETIESARHGKKAVSTVRIGDLQFQLRCSPLLTKDGKYEGIVGVFVDCTGRIKTE